MPIQAVTYETFLIWKT